MDTRGEYAGVGFHRYLILAVAAAVLLACSAAGVVSAEAGNPVAASSAHHKNKKPSGFQPRKFKGKWTGSWTNLTFGTSGPASVSLRVRGKRKRQKMIGVFKLGGSAFGCESVAPRKVTIKKGKGKNRWNRNGFSANWKNDSGPAFLKYNFRKKTVTGGGLSPCSSDIAYRYNGRMTIKKITASVKITLEGKPFAKSKFSVSK